MISDYEAPHGHRLVWVDGIEWLAMGTHISYYWFLVHSGSTFAAREAELLAGDTDQVSRSLAHGSTSHGGSSPSRWCLQIRRPIKFQGCVNLFADA